ncbi:hypothetical protein M413DRAFT_9625 [Hebeloma cylindrosporum]|uniref:Uncharacterized protein n=1 Tax=Hebeloma cylindrosporum TaxID=76867 RepID=A0A0C3CHM8_HEBCY|nr:hypothetical protein M413DRAFT_9625 [Hebeloma cylindrosporum h7]
MDMSRSSARHSERRPLPALSTFVLETGHQFLTRVLDESPSMVARLWLGKLCSLCAKSINGGLLPDQSSPPSVVHSRGNPESLSWCALGRTSECTWRAWGVKCNVCMSIKHSRCSYQESPEERQNHAEAAFAHGQDSLTYLCQLLDRMNDLCNMANANAALAQVNFNQYDWLTDEFITQLYHLAGEESEVGLTHNIFSEDTVLSVLDSILDEIPKIDHDIPIPPEMQFYIQQLLDAVQSFTGKDQLARDTMQCDISPSPSVESFHGIGISASLPPDDDDNIYASDNETPRARNRSARQLFDSDNKDLPKHPDDLIDNEAQEMPNDHQSQVLDDEEIDQLDESGPPSLLGGFLWCNMEWIRTTRSN